ncbi:MAG: c-type cytochrome biogenesis protein CcmI [Devosia sp. 67-54]|uniref:c-type cytochrome biogenesis protein CcmI n=1 Tax=unclassified Devosia TaxID=196773 RepID=UPI000963D8AE|nr:MULTISPECIES: c-type cytochrome biogenesis protein CcmI [unclassified Devosia]MBN9305666.1 c-type cytochrome biogenesis protein CcmI [Devosia sp.]OJX19230.1 MAG: c-type cytochrome biogenesis protein CcmI [Devosia sp. 67-54]
MTIWLLAIILTAIACATLYYAGAGRPVNAGASVLDATTSHYRAQLGAIESDLAAGRLGSAEAVAAKGELARELIRLKGEAVETMGAGSKAVVWVAIGCVAVLALGTYWVLGRPDLPAEPLSERVAETGANLDLDAAIKTIEARLAKEPDDLRGWQVIAPAYMQLGRYADAVHALRRVNALAPPTADSLTNLGEALMMQNQGSVAGEPLALFHQAAALDPKHIRSRYYIAGEETRSGDYTAAVRDWNALLALGKGDEPWMATARNGLAYAQQQLSPNAAPSAPETGAAPPALDANAPQIQAMVDGLEARLKAQGGSIEEWTQLVRSRLVQGRMDAAQADYELARKAYPDAAVRTELDVLAADSGLVAK